MHITRELKRAIKKGMHAEYAQVRFNLPRLPRRWPQCFATITAFATTGEVWSPTRNKQADAKLKKFLQKLGIKIFRITGYSVKNPSHAEEGWAAPLAFDDACDIGLLFKQDAIYYIIDDALFVSYCDQRRKLIPMGRFISRVDQTKKIKPSKRLASS
jgi:hypothetical protein